MKKILLGLLTVLIIFSMISCETDLGGEDSSALSESSVHTSESLPDDEPSPSDRPTFALPESDDVPEEESSDGETSVVPGSRISVLVMGDSIARGYGLDDAEKERFSAVLADKLARIYETVNMSNYGVDGIDGAGFIKLLKEKDIPEMATSDVIIVSIGANNILGPMTEFEGWRLVSGGIDPQIFIDYFRFLFSKDDEKKDAYDYAVESLGMIFKSANQIFGGEAFKTLTETAGVKLNAEIPEIIALIRAQNPTADIYLQTVYNPYKRLKLEFAGVSESLDLSFFGELAVAPINHIISSLAESQGYYVAPVHEVFDSSSGSLTNAGFNLLSADFGVDPHPNAKGHRVIAEMYYKLLTEE